MTEAAIFQARRARQIGLAEQSLNDLPQKTQIPGLRAQAEAAILEAKNEPQAALAKIDESADLTAKMPVGFHRDISLRSLARWKTELAVQAAAGPA